MDKYRHTEGDENSLLPGEEIGVKAIGAIVLLIFGSIVAMSIHDAINNTDLFTALLISIWVTVVGGIVARNRALIRRDVWWRILVLITIIGGIATIVFGILSWLSATSR